MKISPKEIQELKQKLLKSKMSNNAVFTTLGASSHALSKRQKHDYYATDPIAAELLLALESFNTNILEPACGQGHLAKVFEQHGYNVSCTDLIFRGYGTKKDFFDYQKWDGDIITNPPYKYAKEFVEHALEIIPIKSKVAMFLKLSFLESLKRKELFEKFPPKTVYVSSSRIICAKNGDFITHNQSAIAYAWFVWEKGYMGRTVIRWFN